MPYMHMRLMCMAYLHGGVRGVHLDEVPYMCALYVCLICMPYMCVCMAYLYGGVGGVHLDQVHEAYPAAEYSEQCAHEHALLHPASPSRRTHSTVREHIL